MVGKDSSCAWVVAASHNAMQSVAMRFIQQRYEKFRDIDRFSIGFVVYQAAFDDGSSRFGYDKCAIFVDKICFWKVEVLLFFVPLK